MNVCRAVKIRLVALWAMVIEINHYLAPLSGDKNKKLSRKYITIIEFLLTRYD